MLMPFSVDRVYGQLNSPPPFKTDPRISLTTCLRWIVTLPLPVVDAMPTCSGTPSPGPPLTPPTFTLHQIG